MCKRRLSGSVERDPAGKARSAADLPLQDRSEHISENVLQERSRQAKQYVCNRYGGDQSLLSSPEYSRNRINLDTDVTNIIEGPNETGKSVLFKVMYNMIFPGYWSSTELIRRGFTTGIMLLTLADESLLAYTLEGSHYTLILQEGERETTWTDYKMVPKEIDHRVIWLWKKQSYRII